MPSHLTRPHAVPTPDWHGLAAAWERHMAGYVPDRDSVIELLLSVLERSLGPAPHVVELGSGPGRLAAAICDRWPTAIVTAVEIDPLLLHVGRLVYGDRGGRLRRVDADLRDADALTALPRPIDAVVTVAALHELGAEQTGRTLRAVHDLLPPGGLLLDLDWAPAAPGHPILVDAVAQAVRQRRTAATTTAFRLEELTVTADPQVQELILLRRARLGPPPTTEPAPLSADGHRTAFAAAGFTAATELWRSLDLALYAAVA